MIVTLPLPDRRLSPNVRTHFRTVATLKKKHRGWAYWATRKAMNDQTTEGPWPWPRARVQVIWFAKRKPFPDGDNVIAILKSIFDGVADAGIVANDKRFIHVPVLFRWDKADPRIEIHVARMRET